MWNLILTVLVSLFVAFVKAWNPGIPYSAILSDINWNSSATYIMDKNMFNFVNVLYVLEKSMYSPLLDKMKFIYPFDLARWLCHPRFLNSYEYFFCLTIIAKIYIFNLPLEWLICVFPSIILFIFVLGTLDCNRFLLV